MSDNLQFLSEVGHQPWFFVPDTGTPGGTAKLVTPKGREVEVTETQVTVPEVYEAKTDERRPPRLGPRVGFRVPEPFAYAGDYQLVIDQDGTVTTYEITVEAPEPEEDEV